MSEAPPAGTTTRRSRKDWGRGCLLIVLLLWGAWIAIDLVRLGVFAGERGLGDAVFDMPSLGIPLLFVVAFVPLLLTNWRQSRRKKAFPNEPWMWDRRWSRVGARPQEPRQLAAPFAFAALVTVIAVMLALVARYAIRSDFLLLALTPFYLFALGLWIHWGYLFAKILRFRGPFFRYARFPFFLGDRLEGDLEGVERLAGFTQLTVTLRCVREYWTGSGRSRCVARETLHEQVQEIAPAAVEQRLVVDGRSAGATRAVVPVVFTLPAQDLGTQYYAEPVRKWELQARAALPGLDFDATFPIPVYAPRTIGERTAATGD